MKAVRIPIIFRMYDKNDFSEMVNCPLKEKKVSIVACRKCQYLRIIDGNEVLCTYRTDGSTTACGLSNNYIYECGPILLRGGEEKPHK